MANLDVILEGLRAGYARIAQIETVAAQHPSDRFVMASLESIKADVLQMELEWFEQCRIQQVEVCRYRLIAPAQTYTASWFAKSLLEFQELFSQIFDAKKNGVKRRARISGDTFTETAFGFAYSFPGSLGVVLTLQQEPNLFGDKFTDSVAAFNDITSMNDEDDVREAATTLGDAVIKKIYDWSSINSKAGFDVDVTWASASGVKTGGLIDRSSLARIVDLIDKTKDVEKRQLRIPGTLVAIDTIKKRFRFVVPDGEDYSGPVSPAFDLTRKWSVNTPYLGVIETVSVTKFSTQETINTFTLVALETDSK
jgi:hypothetical protein